MRKFLKAMGMRCLKVGCLPAKADPDVQEDYKKNQLEPRLEEAKQGKKSGLLCGCRTRASWELFWVGCGDMKRIFIKAPSGRKR